MHDQNSITLSGEIVRTRKSSIDKLGGVEVNNFSIKSITNNRTLYVTCSWWRPLMELAVGDECIVTGSLVNKKTKTTDKMTGTIIDGWEKAIDVQALELKSRVSMATKLSEERAKLERMVAPANASIVTDSFDPEDLPF